MAAAAAASAVSFPATSGQSSTSSDLKNKVWSHEVAIGELNNLSSSRAVYQKNGNLYFRTAIEKAKAFEEKQLQKLKKPYPRE